MIKTIRGAFLVALALLCVVPFGFSQTQVTRLSSPNTSGTYFSYTSITLDTGFSTAPGQTFRAYILPAGCLPLGSSPTLTQNYIRTSILRTAGIKNVSALGGLSTCELQQTVQYIDGLGRPIQMVQVKGSPDASKDIVQPIIYDEFGRETYKFLPYASGTAANGSFRSDAILQQAAWYNPSGSTGSQLTNGTARNTHPFAVTLMELSPMNKVLEQGAPGAAWQPYNTTIAGSGHTVRMTDSLNNTIALTDTAASRYAALYTISAISSTDQSETLSRGSGTAGYYAANQLTVSIIRDENWVSGRGGTSEEYKDKEGKVVLKRTFNKSGSTLQILSTYYVYDDLGRLAYVLTPKSNADNALPSQAVLDNLCYQYRYDDRGRMTQKKLPGKGWEYMVYNKLDQIVYTQDAKQRAAQQWSWTKYDALARVSMTGIESNNPSSRETIQNTISTQTTLWETRTNSRPEGYTNAAYPMAGEENANIVIHSINYYDDYSFPGANPYPYAGGSQRTTGLLTGNRTAVLDNPADKLWGVTYYDDDGHAVKSYKQHYLGGVNSLFNYDEVTTAYNFTDQPVSATRKHYTKNSGNTAAVLAVTSTNEWDYDHTGRKTNSWQRLQNGSQAAGPRILVSNIGYNEVGQVWKKKLHSENQGSSYLQEVTNTYNERGWMLGAATNSNLFNYSLSYNNPAGTAAKQYNGNISQMNYTRTGTANMEMTYSYDQLNRLTLAASTGNALNETISYDVMGNIMSLSRTGNNGLSLNYSYMNSGLDNRLQTVTNTGNNTTFRTYDYDLNGNATSDGVNKQITYNLLNLPKEVKQGTTTVATYTYDAAGTKLRNTGGGEIWDYIGGIVYKNGAVSFIQTEEGRAELLGGSYHYEYNLSDHLGNVRVSFDKHPTTGAAQRIQEDQYYAFGLRALGGYDNSNNNRYLYNGKEEQTVLANQYDYGARFYDPVIARWTSVDPLAEKNEEFSSFNYVSNNPMIHIDPDGMDLVKISVPANSDGSKQKTIIVDKNVASKMSEFARDVNNKFGFTVNSAFRSKSKQTAMRERWDAGDRKGLRFQPAKKSAHSAGMAFDFNMPKNISGEDLKEFNEYAAKAGFKPVAGDIGHYMLDETKNGYKSRDEAIDANDKYEKDHAEIPKYNQNKNKVIDLQSFIDRFQTMKRDNTYVVPPSINE